MTIQKFILNVIYILFLTIIIDQITKYFAFIYLFKQNQIITINDFLNFRPVWNDGISFGMLQGYGELSRIFFIIVASIISFWIIFYSRKLKTLGFIGYNLIAGGALGNVIDRIFYGKVIDFIDIHYKALHWPTFNIADSFIFIGVILFIVSEFTFLKDKKDD